MLNKQFVYPFKHWWVFGLFLPFTVVNSAILNMSIHIFIWVTVFIFLHICIYLKWRRQWHPTPVLLPGKSHGRRSLVGCNPWGLKESDTPERLHFHISLSCIGEGNGNTFQCSCLENLRDGGAWWAAVYGSHRVGHDWSDLAAAATILEFRMGKFLSMYLRLI